MMSGTDGDTGTRHWQHRDEACSARRGPVAYSRPGRLPSCTFVLGVRPGLRQYCGSLRKASLTADVAAWNRSGMGAAGHVLGGIP